MSICLKILKETGAKDRESFKNSLHGLKDFRGVTGNITFNSERDINKDVYLFGVDDGKIVGINP